MLYNIYETQRSLIEPFTDLAQSAAKLFADPLSAFGQHPLSQRISAAYDLLHRLGKDYEKPEFGIRTVDVDGVEVAIHERVEISKPFCVLRRFKRFTDNPETLTRLKDEPAVLIVAPLSGHYATLLRDTVQTMLKDHKVYITEWINARLIPTSEGEFDLSDYVNYVQEFIAHVQGLYGNCHVMSVCQPTVPVLAAVSLMATRGEKTPLSMVMMGGPIDAQRSPTRVNNLAMNKSLDWFENNVIYRVPSHFPGAGRKVYPGFLQHTGFVAMNPSNHMRSHFDYFKDLIRGDDASAEAHRQFYDEYNAVLDMDAAFYLETIRVVFQDFALINQTWDVRNPQGEFERVRPQDIRNTALMSIEGELDDISGSGQTEAVHDLCIGVRADRKVHYEVKGAGHYGIFSGRRWREKVYPRVQAFIRANQPEPGELMPSAKEQLAETAQALQVALANIHPEQPSAKPRTRPSTSSSPKRSPSKALKAARARPAPSASAASNRKARAQASGATNSKARAGASRGGTSRGK